MSISLILLLVVTLVRLAIFAFVIYAAVQGSRLCGSTTAPGRSERRRRRPARIRETGCGRCRWRIKRGGPQACFAPLANFQAL